MHWTSRVLLAAGLGLCVSGCGGGPEGISLGSSDSASEAQPLLVPREAATTWRATPVFHLLDPAAASGASQGPFIPSSMRHVYGFDQLNATGAGQTIAIVDAPGDPDAATALAQFSTTYSLPAAQFSQVYASGAAPKSYDSGWGLETDLDIEWAHAIAPQARILLVVAASSNSNDLLTAIQAASQSANVVSMSWGGPEFSGESSYDSYFTHSGVTYVASAGDSGAGVNWPAVSVNVTGVGGTTLTVNSSGQRVSEVAWSGSGGGTSTQETEPAYQKKVQSSGFRTVPDVAYDADPNTGVVVLDSAGAATQVGGTSMGAPQWAALVALVNSSRTSGVGLVNTALYPLGSPSSDFFDVTSGSDGSAASDAAHAGYDDVTGLGSPQSQALVPALVSGGTPSPTPTPSPSPSPTPTPKSSPSPSPTPKPSPTPTPSGAPSAPTRLTASASSATVIDLSWINTSSSATSIVVQYSTNDVTFSTLGSLPSGDTGCSISGVAAGHTYYFRVQADNAHGSSPYSNVASATTP